MRQHSRRRELLRPRGRRSRSGCGAARGWAALRAPSRVLLAVGDAQHAALLHDRGPSKFLRQTAPQLELTGSAGLVVSQRLADARTPPMDLGKALEKAKRCQTAWQSHCTVAGSCVTYATRNRTSPAHKTQDTSVRVPTATPEVTVCTAER